MGKAFNATRANINSRFVRADKEAVSVPSVSRVKDIYKEIISLLKDTLDVAWKIAPLALMPAALLLWTHLNAIGWTELFQDSAMSGAGLIFLFAAATLIAIAVAVQVIIPSIFMLGGLSFYDYERPIPQGVMQLYLWTLAGWLLGLGLLIAFDLSEGWPVAPLTFCVALLIALIKHQELDGEKEGSARSRILKAIGASMLAAFTMLGTCFPLIFAINIAGQYGEVGVGAKILAFVVCAGASVVSLLPGFAHLQGRTRHTGFYRPLRITAVGFLMSMYVFVSVATFFAPVSSTILRLAGVFSNESQTFQILQPNLVNAMSVAGLSSTKPIGDMTLVSAYRRYSFGGIHLLCREQYVELGTPSTGTREERLHANESARIAAGSHCVRALANEIRSLRS